MRASISEPCGAFRLTLLLSRVYRLPHPTLITSAFLSRPSSDLASSSEESIVALLSLSSSPSRIAGLGPQCMPVLSFHSIDADSQTLANVPWGPNRRPPDAPAARRSSEAGSSARGGGTGGSSSQPSKGEAPTKGKAKYGPSATGKVRDPRAVEREETELARTLLARAHVPLPPVDALGAHHIVAVPAAWGGGVVVFSENSILYVPPPRAVSAQRSASSADIRLPSPQQPVQPSSSFGESAKRRKASVDLRKDDGAEEQSGAAFSPASVENQHGKRARRSMTKDASAGAGGIAIPEGSALSTSPEATRGSVLAMSPPSSFRRASTAGQTSGRPSIMKVGQKLPVKVVAAVCVPDLVSTSPDSVIGRVIYCTHAGSLEVLNLHLAGPEPSGAQPLRLSIQSLGQVSRPGGPDGLTYLGEGFLHIASASGDSIVVQLREGITSPAASTSPTSPVSPIAARTALPSKPHLAEIQRFPNLAPILDFVVDDGSGGSVDEANAVQARIITASGTDSTGSLRIIRSGVSIEVLADLGLDSDTAKLWSVDGRGPGSKVFILDGDAGCSFWLMTAEAELEDVTAPMNRAGVTSESSLLAVTGLTSGDFVVVSASAIHYVIMLQGGTSGALSTAAENRFTAAAVAPDGTVLVVTDKQELMLFRAEAREGLRPIARVQLSSPVSSLAVSTADKLAVVGTWSSELELFKLPDLQRVTPSSMQGEALSALPTSVLLQRFQAASSSALHLLAGLGDGSIVTYTLSLPRADSVSKNILVLEKKQANVGNKPVELSSLELGNGASGVFAACDRPTVLTCSAERGALLSYSAVQAKNVRGACQLAGKSRTSAATLALLLPNKIQLVNMGPVQKLDIARVELGADNPVALARYPYRSCIAVACWRFLPYGRKTSLDSARGSIKIFDDDDFELLHSMRLFDNERPNCVEYVELKGNPCIVVGTGFINDDESETTRGRVMVFEVVSAKIRGVTQRTLKCKNYFDLSGNVYAVAGVRDRIVAAVNSDVIFINPFFYDAEKDTDEEDYPRWGCAFIACTLSVPDPTSGRVVVGDAMRSIAVLRLEGNGKITEMARDCDPYWTTATEMLDEPSQRYIGSDISFNLYISQRSELSSKAKKRLREIRDGRLTRAGGGEEEGSAATSAWAKSEAEQKEDETWSHVMHRAGVWHYGDLINKFRRGECRPGPAFPAFVPCPEMLTPFTPVL